MKSKYFPPKLGHTHFHCILCNVDAHQDFLAVQIKDGEQLINTTLKASFCSHCRQFTFWYGTRMIVPSESAVEPAHPDLPADCKGEYAEARDVFSRSPRAAAALLRLCIQKLMPHLGETGENINADIKSLVVKGLPVNVQKALDYCRVVGNHAVHPGEINLNDTPEIAERLFEMINFIVEDRITRPKEIETLYSKLPEEARKAIEERDKT